MGFGSKLSARPVSVASGFALAQPVTEHYKEGEGDRFRNDLTERSAAVEFMPPSIIRPFGLDGRLDQGLRMSDAAFSDLCMICGVQVKTLNRMAEIDAAVATHMIDSMLANVFQPNAKDRVVVVDTHSRRIDGIVSKSHYRPFKHDRLFNAAVTGADQELTFTNGWIDGSAARFTLVSPKMMKITPALDDVVRFGMSYENSLNGESSIRISAYSERLVCTNGMTARDGNASVVIPHRGDLVDDFVTRNVSGLARFLKQDGEMMQTAASRILTPPEITTVRKWAASSANGGSVPFESRVIKNAIAEAKEEGRDGSNGEITLWNYVNGFTEQQHGATTSRRNTIEAMGHRCLRTHVASMYGFDASLN